jgi:hypothetical protein
MKVSSCPARRLLDEENIVGTFVPKKSKASQEREQTSLPAQSFALLKETASQSG